MTHDVDAKVLDAYAYVGVFESNAYVEVPYAYVENVFDAYAKLGKVEVAYAYGTNVVATHDVDAKVEDAYAYGIYPAAVAYVADAYV